MPNVKSDSANIVEEKEARERVETAFSPSYYFSRRLSSCFDVVNFYVTILALREGTASYFRKHTLHHKKGQTNRDIIKIKV